MSVAAVFDVDGTLVTFEFDVRGTRKALIEDLSRRGFDTVALSMNTPTQEILDFARGQVERGRVNVDLAELRSSAYGILDAFESESSKLATVFPGTRRALEALGAGGVRLAVLTNSGRKATDRVLAKAGLADCFEFVLTRDDTDTMKPRPEGLTKAVAMLELDPGEVYYVGDSVFDVTASKLAGTKSVCVATGNYSADRLRSEGADYVVSSITELPALLGVQGFSPPAAGQNR